MAAIHIASLEDDAAQARLIESLIVGAGYQCTSFGSSKAILTELARAHNFDVLLLDWEVPDISGLEVLRRVRAKMGQSLPIMFVTSRVREEDIVQGLEAGADDYVTKPVKTNEFLARIAALQRRARSTSPQEARFSCGAYEIDPACGLISLNNQSVDLARKEYELALLFFRNPGRLFSRDLLSSSVWDREIPAASRTLDTHLSTIRRKLRLRPENGVRLSSSYALGYRLELLADLSASPDL